MAQFAEASTYLKYGERPYGKTRSLLWPVLVYRVLYPDAQTSQLNLFQQAVLGLIRAKVCQPEVIADLTGLHEDLIKLILAQGIRNGWFSNRADSLTDKGIQVLEDEEDANANLKSGYLFRDAMTGGLWPRFQTELKEISPIDPKARFPEFLGERKTGNNLKPYMLRGEGSVHTPLDSELLMRAYREYRDDFSASRQLYGAVDSARQVKLQGIQFLDDTPRPAHVLVWVVADQIASELWSVKDPFDLRDKAWWLEGRLQQMVTQDSNLLGSLSGLIGKPKKEEQTVEQWLASIKQEIDLQVLIEYPWVESQPDIKHYLAGLLERREKILQGQAGTHDLEAAVMESQKLLEVLLQWLIGSFPADVGHLPKKAHGDWQLNQQLLAALGVPAFSEEVIRQLARQTLSLVVKACSRPGSSVKALLFAAAFGALNHPQHPLKSLSAEQLQLEKLLELANIRNPSSHAQSRYTGKPAVEITAQLAQQQIQYALSFVDQFKEWM